MSLAACLLVLLPSQVLLAPQYPQYQQYQQPTYQRRYYPSYQNNAQKTYGYPSYSQQGFSSQQSVSYPAFPSSGQYSSYSRYPGNYQQQQQQQQSRYSYPAYQPQQSYHQSQQTFEQPQQTYQQPQLTIQQPQQIFQQQQPQQQRSAGRVESSRAFHDPVFNYMITDLSYFGPEPQVSASRSNNTNSTSEVSPNSQFRCRVRPVHRRHPRTRLRLRGPPGRARCFQSIEILSEEKSPG